VPNLENYVILDVRCGGKFTMILTEDDKILVAGEGKFGQLGDGNIDKSVKFKPVNSFESFCLIEAGW